MPQSYVLIGGGLAATKAAEMLRRTEDDATITLISDENVLPYDRPPLSKEYLRGEWDAEKILLNRADFYQEHHVDVQLGRPVEKIDLAGKAVTLASGEVVSYDKLLYATGGRPRRLKLRGSDLQSIYYLRSQKDSKAIRDEAAPGKRAVIIGGGFIGMEVAASLTKQGVHVTVLEALPHIWSRFLDQDLATYFQTRCRAQGVTIHASVTPTGFTGQQQVTGVAMEGGTVIPCDFVCVGVGIEPNVELAEAAGLQVDNGVAVDEYMLTSNPDVYAAGDVANYYDHIFEKRRRVEHWGHAEYTGLLAAQNMTGKQQSYDLLSYVWSDIFNLHIEFAGEEKDYDELLVRGNKDEDSFIVMYLKDARLRAYLAVNTSPRSFIPMQRMIRQRFDLGGIKAQLQDPGADLRELYQSLNS